MHKRGKRFSFTLIELLAVVGIASVLIGLMIPAFNRMTGGNKVDDASGRFKLGLELAQSIAVSKNRYVAMVLPNNFSSTSEIAKYRLGGFRHAFVKKDTSGSTTTWTFDGWVDNSDWKNEPNGAVLAGIYKLSDAKNKLPFDNDLDDVSTQGDNLGKTISGCITSVAGALNNDLLLPLKVKNNEKDKDAKVLDDKKCIVVMNPRGGIANSEDMYFVIAGAEIIETDVKYTETAPGTNNPVNYRIIKVNKYTGRVEYR